jgi:hypothetical protein
MSKEYEEFYRDEYPFKDDLGKDSLPGPPPVKGHAYLGGNYSSIFHGGTMRGDGKGNIWGYGDGSGGDGGGGDGAPIKPHEIIWRHLATLTASIVLYDILKDPATGKIMIDKIRKILKGFDDKRTWIIEAGLWEEYAGHLDCIVMEFVVNGKKYNESESDEALSNFFMQGINGGNSQLTLRTKWQDRHYPPDVSTIFLKIRDVEEDKEEVDNIALLKDFRDTIIVKMENKELFFDKHVGA